MAENLVIVESPAKARTIEKILGTSFEVKSSFGHIRDLSKKNLGIDVGDGFKPDYIIPEDKTKVVSDLKKASKKASTVWLASDEDREGEAIAWHLQDTLSLDPSKTKRIVFHEITKDAILNAIENPRSVDMNLVMAQQARRVLDRLVGFELSPVLWKKIKPQLSAGRVQSVAVRLIVDREREIISFKPAQYFKIEGIFNPDGVKRAKIKTTLDKRFDKLSDAEQFLNKCIGANFRIGGIEKKEGTRTPPPPFTTSGLQQEASRKFGFSVNQTMSVAQKLYESGLITYMRTDSVNLSKVAIASAKKCIEQMYGKQYSKTRQYQTKSKGAQEAHEAIRPTYLQNAHIEGSPTEKKLYDLIWKRTIASQMADAKIEKTDISIESDKFKELFLAKAEQVIFDGFLKIYMESSDDESDENDQAALLPPISLHQKMNRLEVTATERLTQRPPRYNEASLVKKMEELGIGRPSTYAPTITTIMNRGYITREDRPGTEHSYQQLRLIEETISRETRKEILGKEKAKLFPLDIGMLVTDFLAVHFPNILDYGFTAKVEEDFDKVAEGKMKWDKLISSFYAPFHEQIEHTTQEKSVVKGERLIGKDPASGKNVYSRMGRFGPIIQIGESDDPEKRFASLKKDQLIESITLDQALKLFELPRELGTYQERPVSVSIGRFGPYIKHNSTFISIGTKYDPYSITLEEAITAIEEKREKDSNAIIATYPEHELQILNGRYGPYIKKGNNNYKIPKGTDAHTMTLETVLNIVNNSEPTGKKKRGSK